MCACNPSVREAQVGIFLELYGQAIMPNSELHVEWEIPSLNIRWSAIEEDTQYLLGSATYTPWHMQDTQGLPSVCHLHTTHAIADSKSNKKM